MSLPEGFPCSIPSGQNTQWHNTELGGNMSVSADSSGAINNYPCFVFFVVVVKGTFFSLMFRSLCSSGYVTLTKFGGGSSVLRRLT